MVAREFEGHRFECSSEHKLLFPEQGISKGELIDYYMAIAEVMLPHIANRPLTLQRFPDGIDHEGFFQQNRPEYFPEWIDSVKVPRAHGNDSVDHVLANNTATLGYLANQGVITIHGWLSRVGTLHCPDRMVFDLDPSKHDPSVLRKAARWTRELMEQIGMTPFLMSTGSKGLHVVAPLTAESDFETVRTLAHEMAHYLAVRHPRHLTTEQRKNRRGGRIYLDVMRNAQGQTSVAPYSVRPLPGAPVATPLSWNELGRHDPAARYHTLRNIFRRLVQKGDPWEDMARHAIDAKGACKVLHALPENV